MSIQKRLLMEDKLTMDKALSIAHGMEMADNDMKVMKTTTSTSTVLNPLYGLLAPNGSATSVVEITTPKRIVALKRRNATSVANKTTLLQYASLGREQRRPIRSLVKIADVPRQTLTG